MKRVLVATDGSEAADRAVDYAAGLAKREKADLLVVNVVGGQAVVKRSASYLIRLDPKLLNPLTTKSRPPVSRVE